MLLTRVQLLLTQLCQEHAQQQQQPQAHHSKGPPAFALLGQGLRSSLTRLPHSLAMDYALSSIQADAYITLRPPRVKEVVHSVPHSSDRLVNDQWSYSMSH